MSEFRTRLPGLALVALLSLFAWKLAALPALHAAGLGPLTLALLLGTLFGNLAPAGAATASRAGLAWSQKPLLRWGVALYGFNLSLQQVAALGFAGIGTAWLSMASTLLLGWLLGRYWLRMDRDSTLLTAAGSAICGAAAIMAVLPLLPGPPEKQAARSAAAVASVTLFGTLAMLLYPLLYPWLGLPATHFGVYVGATVHEVAQVVAIGNALGPDVAGSALIAKMLRVLLLLPFLLLVSFRLQRNADAPRQRIAPPWFALAFVACLLLNSLPLPVALVAPLRQAAGLLLTGAMVALGCETTLARLRQTGLRPFLLSLCLFVHLFAGGALLSRWLAG